MGEGLEAGETSENAAERLNRYRLFGPMIYSSRKSIL